MKFIRERTSLVDYGFKNNRHLFEVSSDTNIGGCHLTGIYRLMSLISLI